MINERTYIFGQKRTTLQFSHEVDQKSPRVLCKLAVNLYSSLVLQINERTTDVENVSVISSMMDDYVIEILNLLLNRVSRRITDMKGKHLFKAIRLFVLVSIEPLKGGWVAVLILLINLTAAI